MPRAGIAAATLLAVLQLLALAAGVYAAYAEQHLDTLPSQAAAQATVLATALTPWSPRYQSLHGWVHAESGDFATAEAAYRTALRGAPADAVLWTEYALALSRSRVFDERLTIATQRALTLAPASPAVRHSIARMALSYWRYGSAALREQWQQTLRWEIDHNRESFLRSLEQEGYRDAFCSEHSGNFTELDWCREGGP